MILLLMALLGGCPGGRDTIPVYTGTVEVTEVDVSSVLPGRIVAVKVREGDSVAEGDILFTLDTIALDLELDAKKAAINQARAAVGTTRAQSQAASAQVSLYDRELTRMKSLEASGAGTAQGVSQLTGQLDASKAQLQAYKQGIAQAEAVVAQAEQAVKGVEEKLKESSVKAPIAGVVLSRNREPGEVVGAGMSVVTIGDLAHPRLRVYLPLTAMESTAVGKPVQVRLDNDPEQVIPGQVSWIAAKAEFTPRDILTPEERVKQVFAVEVDLPQVPGLHPGVPAEATF